MNQVLEAATIRQSCKQLRLPTIGAQCGKVAAEAVKEKRSHLAFLIRCWRWNWKNASVMWSSGVCGRRSCRRMKTLEEFDFNQSPRLPAMELRQLAESGYLEQAEPVVLIGDCGTGKTHLATGRCVAACRQKKRVRFTTVAGLVNELGEAQHHNQLGWALARWSRYELIALDEGGYVPQAEVGAELLFQVIADRAERAALVITTNLPFSEWTQVFPNARFCKALLDRITDRTYYRNRERFLSLPQNHRRAAQKT